MAGARCGGGGAGNAGRGAAGAAMGDDMDAIPEREMKVRGGEEQAGCEGAGGGGGGSDRLGPLSRASRRLIGRGGRPTRAVRGTGLGV